MSKVEVNTIEPQCGTTLTLGGSGDTVALGSGASQTGFGRTGTVDWVTTPKTATFTAATGSGYFVNTTAGLITVNLPAGAAGSIVSLADYAATWQTYKVTVTPNGVDKIGGVSNSITLFTEGQSVTLVYVDSTQGWVNTMDSTSNVRGSEFVQATGGTITCSGNDKIHTFTGPGTFTVTATGVCAANNLVSHAVVAGGGGGGGSGIGGGGGGGGFREVVSPSAPYTASPLNGYPSAPNRITVTATGYPITVGAGGVANSSGCAGTDSTSGDNSVFSTITSAGGGYGKQSNPNPGNPGAGGDGGAGGGGSGGSSNPLAGGAGNTPPTTPAQGFNGGTGWYSGSPPANLWPTSAGGGGGGATVVGTNSISGTGGNGGTGATTEITASPVAYSGGGGGGVRAPSCVGTSPCGSGGQGSNYPQGEVATAGAINKGGGGGGHDSCSGIAGGGGSGVVIIRYKYK